MDQLTALDAMFLDLEDENVQMNIGGVSVIEGPAPSFAELQAQVAAGLDHTPRYRQCLHELPRGFGRPVWVDDQEFNLGNHLFELDLGESVEFEEICDHYAKVMAEHLDRAHPLWKIHICRGLPDGRWAVLWTVHHAMVDGVAATDLLSLLLSPDPGATKPAQAQEWVPKPIPAATGIAAGAASGEIGPLRLARGLRGAAREPSRSLTRLRIAANGFKPLARTLFKPGFDVERPRAINGPIGPARTWRVAELDLKAVKRVAKANWGTVNDFVLSAVTDGMRANMLAHGQELDGQTIRTMVPVSVRTEDEAGAVTNRVSAVFVELPVSLADPAERLAAIRLQMGALKEQQGEQTAKLLGEIADFIPYTLFAPGERTIVRGANVPKYFNTVITNIPGPQFPLYCLGRRMEALFPYVMLVKELRITTAVFSYDGKVFFGVTGDAAGIFDIERVCDSVSSAIDRLAAASPPVESGESGEAGETVVAAA
jgi:WS/DGAT/MGAT family acyltransferase